MAIELSGIVPRHERRLRLVFTSPVASGAFGSPAPAYYTVENEDSTGPDPTVLAAIAVGGSANNVELALGSDLAAGGLYRVRALGVPALDASTSTSASDQHFRFAIPGKLTNVEPKVSDRDLLLYGRDLVWTGLDFLETAEADLATTAGPANAMEAINRRMLGSPLAWAREYSPRARQYVDAPVPSIGPLRARLEAQALRDDRIRGVTAKLVLDDSQPERSYFEVTPILVGGRPTDPINVHVFI